MFLMVMLGFPRCSRVALIKLFLVYAAVSRIRNRAQRPLFGQAMRLWNLVYDSFIREVFFPHGWRFTRVLGEELSRLAKISLQSSLLLSCKLAQNILKVWVSLHPSALPDWHAGEGTRNWGAKHPKGRSPTGEVCACPLQCEFSGPDKAFCKGRVISTPGERRRHYERATSTFPSVT